MSKSSFTVIYPKGDKEVVISGVTSIYPNLNGFLFCTEDRENHFIESCDLIDKGMSNLTFSYQYTDEDFEDFARLEHYEFHEHRNGYYDYSDLK